MERKEMDLDLDLEGLHGILAQPLTAFMNLNKSHSLFKPQFSEF